MLWKLTSPNHYNYFLYTILKFPGQFPPMAYSRHKLLLCLLISSYFFHSAFIPSNWKVLDKNTPTDLTWNSLRGTSYNSSKDDFMVSPSFPLPQSIRPQVKSCLIFTEKVWAIRGVLPHLTTTESTNLHNQFYINSWNGNQHSNIFLLNSFFNVCSWNLLIFPSSFPQQFICTSHNTHHFPSGIT